MMDNKKLSIYGYSFQTKLISCLMTDAAFVGQVYDILKVDYFEADAVQFLVKRCISYFTKYKRTATIEVLKVGINKVEDPLHRAEIIRALKAACESAGSSDEEFIKETTIAFCKNQELKNAILESVQLLQNEDYDSIKSKIDSALKVGMDSNIGLEYFEKPSARYAEDSRNPIPTGWPVLDEIMKGGLGPGELGMAIAPSGAGKSWLLASIGANALKQNKRVVHYTLELSENYTGIRYDCILTGIPIEKTSLHIDKIESALKDHPGELIIKWFPTKSVSLMGLRAHLSKLKVIDKSPDLVVIDYADLLKSSNPKLAKHEMLEILYEELRGLAGEFELPVWTVSQSNREGLNDDIIEADKAAGAYAKIFTADFVMSLSRKAKDKLSNTARLHVIKNRFGPDGMTFPAYMDTSRGAINIYQEASESGTGLIKDMQTDGEYEKSRLRQRLTQLKK